MLMNLPAATAFGASITFTWELRALCPIQFNVKMNQVKCRQECSACGEKVKWEQCLSHACWMCVRVCVVVVGFRKSFYVRLFRDPFMSIWSHVQLMISTNSTDFYNVIHFVLYLIASFCMPSEAALNCRCTCQRHGFYRIPAVYWERYRLVGSVLGLASVFLLHIQQLTISPRSQWSPSPLLPPLGQRAGQSREKYFFFSTIIIFSAHGDIVLFASNVLHALHMVLLVSR